MAWHDSMWSYSLKSLPVWNTGPSPIKTDSHLQTGNYVTLLFTGAILVGCSVRPVFFALCVLLQGIAVFAPPETWGRWIGKSVACWGWQPGNLLHCVVLWNHCNEATPNMPSRSKCWAILGWLVMERGWMQAKLAFSEFLWFAEAFT